METGEPDVDHIHPKPMTTEADGSSPLQFVELLVTEGYISAELRKLGFIGVSYAFGATVCKAATSVVRYEHLSEFVMSEVKQAVCKANIILANVPNSLSEFLLQSVLLLLSETDLSEKKVLLLFRSGSNHRVTAHSQLPMLRSETVTAGPDTNPHYRRHALVHNCTVQSHVRTSTSKSTTAGDGMPRSWAIACAGWLAHGLTPNSCIPTPHHHVRGQPSHRRTRLISEFDHVEHVTHKGQLRPGDKVSLNDTSAKVLMAGGNNSQDLHTYNSMINSDKDSPKDFVDKDFTKDLVGKQPDNKALPNWLKVGVWRTPDEFIAKAKSLIHPFDDVSHLPDEILEGLYTKLTSSAKEVAAKRLSTLKWVRDLQHELTGEEERLKAEMNEGVRAVVRGRSIKLMEHLLRRTGFVDTDEVIAALCKGVNITESVSFSKAFPARYEPPQLAAEQLLLGAEVFKDELEKKMGSYGSSELDAALEDKVNKDLKNGWASGPYTRSEVDEFLGSKDWIPSRRFPVIQAGGSKVRAIDDYTESGWNYCVGVRNRWTQHTLDEVALLATCFPRLSRNGWVQVALGSGRLLEGSLAAACPESESADFQLKGCTVDLESAFRQLPLHPAAACAAPLCFYSASAQGPRYICLRALPFGSVSSVAWFLRYAKALWHLGAKLLNLSWLSFFDDYILLEFAKFEVGALQSVLILLKLLGVPVANDKLGSLSDDFVALGVHVHLLGGPLGLVRLENKPGRVVETIESIRHALAHGRFTTSDVQKARGRLGFISGFVSSKLAAYAVAKIKTSGESPQRSGLSASSRLAMEWLVSELPKLKPRLLGVALEAPVLLFSDASDEGWGLGGVLVDVHFAVTQFFRTNVPDKIIKVWGKKGSKQLIAQAEAYAGLVCVLTWSGRLAGRRVLHFLDNVAAESTYVSLSTRSGSMEDCLRCMVMALDELDSLVWYCRCPSASNPADAPSRASALCQDAWMLGAAEVTAVHPCEDFFQKPVEPQSK